jgi:hypothetical protein
LDVAESARIDVVKGFEVAIGIPPAVSEVIKFFNFFRIDVFASGHVYLRI